ncbi:hypothetical protein B0H34DRAFT_729041 [Crassisporium funariophilum]|nr:hypothetical protein B0H34DRAFT_729041 [Crassisporium funariophilum]
MFKNLAVSIALGIWASYLPTAAALSWDICTTNDTGAQVCRSRIPRSARIAIAVACVFVLILLGSFVFCCIKNRRRAATSEQEYNVEASQVDGPPTIIATEYNPTSGGPSARYSGPPKSGHFSGRNSPGPQMTAPAYSGRNSPGPQMTAPAYSGRNSPGPQMTGPAYPVAAQVHYSNNQNYTAPVSQASFPDQPYPFTGYSPRMGPSAPKTAFLTGGFPRPLLAGNRLKDRLKERPASVSTTQGLVDRQ